MLPDYEDPEPTMRDPSPTAPSLESFADESRHSCVQLAGARAAEAMTERQLNLGVTLVCLEHEIASVRVFDRSARAALETLHVRFSELAELRDALDDLHAEAPLFPEGAPLTAFVGGLYQWCEELVDTLGEIVRGLRLISPDWARVRRRLEMAAEWYFDGLAEEVRQQVQGDRELSARVESLLCAASVLEKGLARKFG
jgi:hypothetical protein